MPINSILDLKFKTILCDVSGVIFDEEAVFPNVNETFEKLLSEDRQIILLSNAPREEEFLRQKLKKSGFAFYEKLPVLTAGMYFLDYASKQFSKTVKYCTIGTGENSLLSGDLFEKTSIEEAQVCIIYYMGYHESYLHDIKKVVARDIPVFCINPDVKIETPDGIKFCAGKTAKIIEAEGGIVKYFGKPYSEVFEFLQGKYLFKKEETVLIGDSMMTDVLGAKNFGIQGVLVLSGVHKMVKNFEEFFARFSFKPNFMIDKFK
jgi:HAD superfamily hydrolase (TIGR01459 family)